MTRVLAKTLDHHEDDDLHSLDGTPFTGLAYTLAKDGRLKAEMDYRNGRRCGATREWYGVGRLMVESNFFRGVLHGRAREWHPNGQLAEDGEYEFGITLWEKHWDESGQPTKDYALTESDQNHHRLLQRRQMFAKRE